MSPEQATDQLATLQAAYDPPRVGIHAATATEASQRLAQLGETPDFLRKLEKGDLAARDEFQRLTELKNAAMPGELTVEPILETTAGDTGLTRRDLISVAEDMFAEGVFNEAGIELVLNDGKFPTEDVYVAQLWLERMEADETLLLPELGGDRELQMKFLRAIAAIGDGSMP
jgi:hypothetical protein